MDGSGSCQAVQALKLDLRILKLKFVSDSGVVVAQKSLVVYGHSFVFVQSEFARDFWPSLTVPFRLPGAFSSAFLQTCLEMSVEDAVSTASDSQFSLGGEFQRGRPPDKTTWEVPICS